MKLYTTETTAFRSAQPKLVEGPLRDLMRFAKQNSPFYSSLYQDVDLDTDSLEIKDVPVVEHSAYWSGKERVLTGPEIDGVIMRTGGSTSKPKFTTYSQDELQRVGALLGLGLHVAGLRVGDRVGNLFYAGECYGSFLLHVLSVAAAPLPAIQVPIGGLAPIESIATLIRECRCTVLLSTVTNLVKLSKYCQPTGETFPEVHTIMFAGEPFFQDQQDAVLSIFPNTKIRSCIFGSIDSGVVATSAGTDDVRLFKTIQGAAIVEICPDEDSTENTCENGVEGSLLVTNLLRRLAPVIRYPVGDRAEWVDYKSGLFRLLGRDRQSVRLGPVSIDFDQMRNIVTESLGNTPLVAFQLIVERPHAKDSLVLQIDASPADETEVTTELKRRLHYERPMFSEHVTLGHIEELRVVFMSLNQMHTDRASGKLKRIVDLRDTTTWRIKH